ncbi:MAG: hypothetical protein K0Q72_1299 [Armatimonadetes bacterium]|nr:hypothetical protein [Armatimonadota bacterium]
MASDRLHIFGIRHHGPGSARSLRTALEALEPDVVLVEGPPEADAMLPLLTHAEMEPPVALLLYVPDEPKRAAYYPFAIYSPEWQAIHYALTRGIPVRFMDLPQAHQLGSANDDVRSANEGEPTDPSQAADPEHPDSLDPEHQTPNTEHRDSPNTQLRHDPLGWLAEAAGFSDGERWWEHMVEHRRDGTDLFAAILEAMTVLREAVEQDRGEEHRSGAEALREARREAWMRQTIRAAQREGHQRIAVVCGAWHTPALVRMPAVKDDAALLKGLPKVKVEATWVPWTYDRLAFESGYGAGVESPGWYHHLWHWPERVAVRWLARVAGLLREADLDASSASVIEAVRLAETLAALRERPLPGLPELNEAVLTVLCFGNDAPMRLIRDKLIVGQRLGKVPDETPMVPLQQDLMRHQKRLRLPSDAAHKDYELDLRKPNDLERSQLLHRLRLLWVPWGELLGHSGLGTFRENWRLQWKPELAIQLIQAGVWGNTIHDAASAYARDAAEKAPGLVDLTAIADQVLLADLPEAMGFLMQRLESQAAVTTDVTHMMDTLPRMAQMIRYPTVRQTDRGMLERVVDGLVTRICIGLPGASSSLDDDAAEQMYGRIVSVHRAIGLLQSEEHREAWRGLLAQLAAREGLHGLIAGRAAWLSFDSGTVDVEETARRMGLALSTASDPPQAAAWVDGFLRGNGQLLVHTESLFRVLDGWVTGLPPEMFTTLLPLLRRTFATFPVPERRHIGERVKSGGARTRTRRASTDDFDEERAAQVLPLVTRLLGLSPREIGVPVHREAN